VVEGAPLKADEGWTERVKRGKTLHRLEQAQNRKQIEADLRRDIRVQGCSGWSELVAVAGNAVYPLRANISDPNLCFPEALENSTFR
jgi:hypothetical protein